jgi:threonine dehydrogenase-like Zn-dependent dehydrogenase
MRTKRALLVSPGCFEIIDAEIDLKPDQLLVKVAACGLCNWELNHWAGAIGDCPQTLGHEWAGEVVETGSLVSGFHPGDRVTALPEDMTGFSEYTAVVSRNAFLLNSAVPLTSALGEPLKCIVTVLKAAAPEASDHGVVIGCGFMGLLCIQALAGRFLSSLTAVDIDDRKLELAKQYGASHLINPGREDTAGRIGEYTQGHLADFVIEGTGRPDLLNAAVRYLRLSGRGRLILMSSHDSASRAFDFREAIDRSIEIRVPHPAYSQNELDDMRRAVDYLNNGTFRMDHLITHRFSLENINQAFKALENKPDGYIKGIVVP